MKKTLWMITLFSLLLFASTQAMAGWTVTSSKVSEAGHYFKWKVVCTCDGNAYSATDLLASMGSRLLKKVQGETLMLLKVSPGTAGVIPDTTINIILSDEESDALWTETAISKDAISWHDLSSDINAFIPVTGKLYLTVNDIGTSGDQVTLYFITWRENI